jgi:histidine ammonia-lyase
LVQQVLASQMIALSNAAALRDETLLSIEGKRFLEAIRMKSPVLTFDRRLDGDLQGLTEMIDQGAVISEP